MIHTGIRQYTRPGKGGGSHKLGLVPMIDILTILVVYLLVHAADAEMLPNSKNVTMPQSIAEQKPREATVITVTRDMLYLNGKAIVSVAEVGSAQAQVIEPLRAALHQQAIDAVPGSEAQREVTVVAEKSLPYAVLRKIVASSSAADYSKLSLAVVERAQTYSGLTAPG